MASLISFGAWGSACAEDGGESSVAAASCAFAVEVEGDVNASLDDRELACAYSLGGSESLSTVFAGWGDAAGEVESVSLRIEGLTRGALGAFPATVTLNLADGGRFQSEACEVEITFHEVDGAPDDFGVPHRVRGLGSCAEPARELSDASLGASLSSFEFATPTSWQ